MIGAPVLFGKRNSNWVLALFSRIPLGASTYCHCLQQIYSSFLLSAIQISRRDSNKAWVPTCISSRKLLYLLWNKLKILFRTLVQASAIAQSDFVQILRFGSWEENAVGAVNETHSTALELRSGICRNQPLGGPNASRHHQTFYVFRSYNSDPKQLIKRSYRYHL